MNTWLKKMAGTAVLCALLFLRMVDLAVFDADHDHVENSHVQVHAAEMVHAHHDDEPTEHDTLDAMSAHVGFHTLLGVFMDTSADGIALPAIQSNRFGPFANRSAVTHRSRPPVPPPLA